MDSLFVLDATSGKILLIYNFLKSVDHIKILQPLINSIKNNIQLLPYIKGEEYDLITFKFDKIIFIAYCTFYHYTVVYEILRKITKCLDLLFKSFDKSIFLDENIIINELIYMFIDGGHPYLVHSHTINSQAIKRTDYDSLSDIFENDFNYKISEDIPCGYGNQSQYFCQNQIMSNDTLIKTTEKASVVINNQQEVMNYSILGHISIYNQNSNCRSVKLIFKENQLESADCVGYHYFSTSLNNHKELVFPALSEKFIAINYCMFNQNEISTPPFCAKVNSIDLIDGFHNCKIEFFFTKYSREWKINTLKCSIPMNNSKVLSISANQGKTSVKENIYQDVVNWDLNKVNPFEKIELILKVDAKKSLHDSIFSHLSVRALLEDCSATNIPPIQVESSYYKDEFLAEKIHIQKFYTTKKYIIYLKSMKIN